jgi:hypothetical protein
MCRACERRTRADAAPLCPDCWDLRARKVEPVVDTRARFFSVGLGLGIASFLPLWPVILASLIVNVMGLTRSKQPELAQYRSKSLIGLSLTLGAILVWGTLVAVLVVIGSRS